MDKLTIVEQIQKSSDLLSLPQAVSELLSEMEKPDFNSDVLSRIVLKDPSLTGRILKIANSSFYHRFSDISTVNQAVVVLGLTTVKCLALSSSVLNPGRLEKATGVDTKIFFTNILTVAAAAESIGRVAEFKGGEEVFIGGLLHEIGVIFFLNCYPEEYRQIVEKRVKAVSLVEAERQVFGIDHAEVGYHLALKWHLPKHIAEAIRDHHDYGTLDEKQSFTNTIRLATLLVDNTNLGYVTDLEGRLEKITRMAELLGLSKEQIDEISGSLMAETVKVAEYVGIDIGSIEDMLTRANKEIWQTYLMIENLFKERQELTRKLLQEERSKGAIESKNIAIATLSHYINNSLMAIYGRTQLLNQMVSRGEADRIMEKLPRDMEVMERSIRKISAALAEIKNISPIDDVEFYAMSQAMNLDDRIEARMEAAEGDSGLVVAEEAETP